MRIIEGTVDEIVEYQKRTGQIADDDGPSEDMPAKEPVAAMRATSLDGEPGREDAFFVNQFVYKRAKDGITAKRVLDYLARAFELGTAVEVGESQRSADGLSPYLMIRDDGPRRFGAVAYVQPSNGGLTLRLRPDDLPEGLTDDRVKLRNVSGTQPYAINCPLCDDQAVELALELTALALDKVRGDATI
jgi:hypothetical protein